MLFILLVQMFPQFLAIVAIYLMFVTISELYPAIGFNTSWSLILLFLGGALGVNTWLMKGFFDTIPKDLDESAKVDGATHFADLLRHHPAAGRADPGDHRAARPSSGR